jgi:outer membrane biosynthesis protein TonB
MKTRYVVPLFLLCSHCFGLAGKAQSQQTSTESSRQILRKTAPAYPEVARRINLGGTVRVIAIVAADGNVKSVEPKGGSPIQLKAAEDAVAKWKFATGSESQELIEVHFAP